MNTVTLGDGSKVKIGDVVCFKADFEQCGVLTKIEPSGYNANHIKLTITNENGFGSEYIGGETVTRESAIDC